MERHHKRSKDSNATLNMVSLMDIFTILVFFLLVSAGDTEVLPTPKKISLPESTAEKAPKKNVVIMVSEKEIKVFGKKVASVRSVIRSKNPIIPNLMSELQQYGQTARRNKKAKYDPKKGITIMGDKAIPYQVLKKIMLTCASASFTNISLAVVQKGPAKDAS
jgi:biopolymer transport protein ExbD